MRGNIVALEFKGASGYKNRYKKSDYVMNMHKLCSISVAAIDKTNNNYKLILLTE